jgi:hypothetical protein
MGFCIYRHKFGARELASVASNFRWPCANNLGPVVQSWISATPGLKFNQLFWFGCICTSVYFRTLENKTSIDPDMNCGKLSSCF